MALPYPPREANRPLGRWEEMRTSRRRNPVSAPGILGAQSLEAFLNSSEHETRRVIPASGIHGYGSDNTQCTLVRQRRPARASQYSLVVILRASEERRS